MNKNGLAKVVAKKMGVSRVKAKFAIEAVFEAIEETIPEEEISIVGFGTFYTKVNPAHKARNPKTGETVMTEEITKPRLKFSRTLKKKVNERK